MVIFRSVTGRVPYGICSSARLQFLPGQHPSCWIHRSRRMSKLLIFLTLAVSMALTGCGMVSNGNQQQDPPPPPPPPADMTAVKHIIYMLQENRSFDQYFGQLNAYRQEKGFSTDVDVTPANASQLSYDHSISFQPFL